MLDEVRTPLQEWPQVTRYSPDFSLLCPLVKVFQCVTIFTVKAELLSKKAEAEKATIRPISPPRPGAARKGYAIDIQR